MNTSDADGPKPNGPSNGESLPPVTGESSIELDSVVSTVPPGLEPEPASQGVSTSSTSLHANARGTVSATADLDVKYRIESADHGVTLPKRTVDAPLDASPVVGVLDLGEDGRDSTSILATVGVDPAKGAHTSQSVGLAVERDIAMALQSAIPGAKTAIPDSQADIEIPGATIDLKVSPSTGTATSIISRVIPAFSNDEASSSSRTDSLDMLGDARAFAQIAASRSTSPPLAVGVFGPWGAGKSFFMDLVHNEVASLAAQSKEQRLGSTSSKEFHSKVIQIRFNAWHYAETNLWASLVGHIFQELSAATSTVSPEDVFGKLSTARNLTLEASAALVQARKEHLHAKQELEGAKTSLAQAQAKPARTGNLFADLMVSAFRDSENTEIVAARDELAIAANEFGIGSAITSTKELTEEGAALLRSGVQAKQLFWAIVKNLGSPWVAALFVFATIAAPFLAVTVLRAAFELVHEQRHWLTEMFTSGAVLATVLATWFKKAAGPMLHAVEKLKNAKARVDAHVARNLENFEKVVAENEAEVAKASANVEAASDLLKVTSVRLAEVREALHGQSAATRLINFVRARASDGEYAKHLSIISTIRKDFEELSNFVSGRVQNPQGSDAIDLKAIRRQVAKVILSARKDNLLTKDEIADLKSLARKYQAEPLPFERIVLFIDDVDRCPPAKVVDVLQAVHMLLAFKLFVVFVAVDVRWVGSSLAQEYRGMLREPTRSDPLTSASDYLEKVFQIPYWVPSITPDSGKSLLASVLSTRPPVQLNAMEVLSSQIAHALSPVANALPRRFVTDKFLPATLDDFEIKLLELFAGVLDSPRKVIRFANIARLLKARDLLGSGDENVAVPVLAQLAIATATPDHYSQWRLVLRPLASKTVDEVMLDLDEGYLRRHPIIRLTLEAIQHRGIGGMKLQQMLDSDKWAGRLSFAVPLHDADSKLAYMITKCLASGGNDIPPFSEILAKPLSGH